MLLSLLNTSPRQVLRVATPGRFAAFSTFISGRSLSTAPAAVVDFEDDAPTASDIAGLQEKYRSDPISAKAVFSATSELTSGLRSTASIRGKFSVAMDEPKALGGTDTAPNPVEVILASLAGCQEITWKAYGQATGTPIESVSVHLDGHIDLRGFFAVDEKVRPGFQEIRGTVTVKSSATTEQLQGLKEIVDGHCPVLDMLKYVPTTIVLKHEAA